MSKQCLDFSQMQHLKELGVDTSKASAAQTDIWVTSDLDEFQKAEDVLVFSESESDYFEFENPIKKFTLGDILDLLPRAVDDELILFIEKSKHKWRIGYADVEADEVFEDFSDVNMIDAAYRTLCWVVENGYIETK